MLRPIDHFFLSARIWLQANQFSWPLILVNKLSASASEILAGAIQDYDRGLIVGTTTFGKGTVQRVDSLSIGQVKYTESKFYRVSGSSTQNKGVDPDIIMPTICLLYTSPSPRDS